MFGMTTIGKIQDLTREYTFEWRIDDFVPLLDKDKEFYQSPHFVIDGESWYLRIYPNCESEFDFEEDSENAGYISVYLYRVASGPSKNLTWTFSLKTVNGKKEYVHRISQDFITTNSGYGKPRFVKISELLEKKSSLVPDGNLTLIFTTEFCSKATDTAGRYLVNKCSYCKNFVQADCLSSHKEVCLARLIRCPTCFDVVELRKWFDHECPLVRVKANKKLVEDLGNIFDTQEHSDLTIKVKDQEFHLHRLILAGRNPYFKCMLNTEMQEKSTGTIYIDDCEPDDYRSFVYFIYTGRVDYLADDNVFPLYELADKYQEDQLKEVCISFMKTEICVYNFYDFIIFALKHEEKELLKVATDLFCREVEDIIECVEWQSFLKQYPTEANELTVKAVKFMSSRMQEMRRKI